MAKDNKVVDLQARRKRKKGFQDALKSLTEDPGFLGRYILDKDGNPEPCPKLFKWAEWMETEREKWQLIDAFEDCRLSTVFLGLDHNFAFMDEGREPILWETMLFQGDTYREVEGDFSGGCWRFATKDEAYAFHQQKVKELRKCQQ